VIDETRIEHALRQGPPFRTHYVRQSLPIGTQVVARSFGATRRLMLLVAVTALLLVGGLAALAAAGFFQPEPDVTSATWTATGPMINSGGAKTATLLKDGRVLVVGGQQTDGYLDDAELFDPRTGMWTATGSMNQPRSWHAATLLPDGTVLVTGGQCDCGDSSVGLGSAELYDPESGSWTAAAPMLHGRALHTSMLLQDGRVLVFGGFNNEGNEGSAELYDPGSDRWTATGSMIESHDFQMFVQLADGRVLVAGGWTRGHQFASAQVYDPETGRWTATGSMLETRDSGTATLLQDGRVLVAGGSTIASAPTANASTAELYDPVTGSWSPAGSMTAARRLHTATLLSDGRLLMAGGAEGESAELYNPVTGSWSAVAPMLVARSGQMATLLLDGRVLLAGGIGDTVALTTAELYDPAGS
jgi:N-acetylneuraminic acid mutarotase